MPAPAIGIDLGTTYSAVAVYRNGHAEIIANDQGNRLTPSFVAFTSTRRFVGEAALYQAAENPTNTIYGVKRLMGREIDDKAIEKDIRAWPFTVEEDRYQIKIGTDFNGFKGKSYYPEEISAMILKNLKTTAESFLGVQIKDVVITVPANFNNSQRQATKDAAQIAGLNILRMINDPAAAAMAYGLSVNYVGTKNVLVFDFGGGTFDVSILTINDKKYKVRATSGDTHLGGEDFDQRMVNFFVGELKNKYNRDIRADKGLMLKLKTHSERAKRTLSFASEAEFALENTKMTGKISRAHFEDMNHDLFEKAIALVSTTLRDAQMTKSEIDEVVLVGGSSRIPKVRKLLSDFFEERNLCFKVNPDEAVALGAAFQAAKLQNNDSDQLKGLKLSDVCPLSLGSEVTDGSVVKIIKRNTTIPVKASETFLTSFANQTTVPIKIYEGERLLARDNHFLGQFTIKGIPPMRRGEAEIVNTYEIDENGILKVTAFIPLSGSRKSFVISNKSRLTKDDANRLAKEAAKYHQQDFALEKQFLAYDDLDRYNNNIQHKIDSIKNKKIKQKAKSIFGEYSKFLKTNRGASKEQLEQKLAELKSAWVKFLNE